MDKIREDILTRVKEIEGLVKVSDHFSTFVNGSNYSMSFICKNDKEFIKSLKPLIDEITSVFGDRINKSWPSKIKSHAKGPKFDFKTGELKPSEKTTYVSYEIWLKPEYES